jgi:hypothetical protein
MADGQFQVPTPGLIVMTTWGSVQQETVQALMDMRSFTEKNGVPNTLWRMIGGALVDKARNESVRMMLRENCQWMLMCDADMAWQPDALLRLLQVAYASHPWADVVGAYCPLRGELALPTIDSGTGTWESWYPGSGVVEVMRTGAAFLLVKRHVFERMPDPWFKMRVPYGRWAEMLADFDNVCRIKFDGRNPFRDEQPETWGKLEKCVHEDPSTVPGQFVPVEVGEDSGFCDSVKLAGMRIVVDTDTVTGHIDRKVLTWLDHRNAIEKLKKEQKQMVGCLS